LKAIRNDENFAVRFPVLKGHLPFWGALAPQKELLPAKKAGKQPLRL
jgi:hypothetical protein